MTRFDWHVLRRFVAASALLMGLLVATFVVLDLAEYVDDFIDRGATWGQVFGTYYLHYVPEIVRLTSPLALFLGAIYVTARLAQSMQLTALHMAGVSLERYMRPFLLVAVVWTATMLAFNGWVVPRSTAVVHAFQNEYYRDAPERRGGAEVYRQTQPGVVLTATYFDRDEGRAFGVSLVTVEDTEGAGVGSRLDAAEMTYVDSLATWRARDVVVREFPRDAPERFRTAETLDTALTVLPRDLAQAERDAERLTLPEARAYVRSLERAGVTERGRPLVGYYSKVSYPFANLVLVLVGVPLASRRRRGGQAAQLALGLGVAFLYLSIQKTIEPLGYVQEIAPVVAAWAPHFLFFGVAVVLFVRANR